MQLVGLYIELRFRAHRGNCPSNYGLWKPLYRHLAGSLTLTSRSRRQLPPDTGGRRTGTVRAGALGVRHGRRSVGESHDDVGVVVGLGQYPTMPSPNSRSVWGKSSPMARSGSWARS